MNTKKISNHIGPTNSRRRRLTIGLAADDIVLVGGQNALLGVTDVARERNVNLLCFHQRLCQRDQQTPAELGPAAWDSLGEIVDGLILYQSWPNEAAFADFRNRFPALPMVNALRIYAGCPAVAPDFYHGIKELTDHFITVHGYRRIALIRGPDNWSMRERYRGYTDALTEHGLSPDPNLVTPLRGWVEAEKGAIPLLLDERGLRPGIDFEVILAANDAIALNVLSDLQKRGVRVPAQVALSGFDGDSRSSCTTPPLTTAQMPAYQIGRRAVEIVLAQLAGEPVPEQTLVPPPMMIRQSCGCMSPTVAQAVMGTVTGHRQTLDAVLAAARPQIVAEMQQTVGKNGATLHLAGQLLDGFATELAGESPGLFMHELDQVLRQVEGAGEEIQPWQNALSVLRRRLRPHLDDENFILADDLWQQGRVMIGETAERVQVSRRVQAEQQANQLREVTQTLITTFNVEGLMDVLAAELPGLGIPGCYLSLYEQHAAPVAGKPEFFPGSSTTPEWSRLVLAYHETGREALPSEGRRFPSQKLVPQQLWPQNRAYSLDIEPLYFQDDQLGFVLFEMGPREGSMYKTLRGQISSALYGALLVQQEEKRSRQLQTVAEVSTAASTVLDTNQLLQQVVDLTKAQFNLYHVHLYLLNETRDTLVLKAGAGEVGREMVAQGWSISLAAEPSLVAHVARTRRGEIVNNVQVDEDWLAVPLLPDTRAELAVPLLSNERLLGVLDVQADEENYFSENDVQVQSTLAAQIAVALQNAGLFEQVAQASAEIQTLNERLKEENLRMEAELDVTQRLQKMLLPSEDELRQFDGLDVAGFMDPADEVGGDYYDALRYNGSIKFGIGDVTGHGLESGMVMLMLQTAVRTLLYTNEKDPVRFLNILNRTLHSNIERMNVDKSLSLALLDYHQGQLRLSGQHEHVIVARQLGKIELIDTINLGFPVGLVTDIGEFVNEMVINLQPGDVVVLYSDGFTESESEAQEFYGVERLCEVISEHWMNSAEEIKQAVVADIRRFIGRQKVYDDLTLLVIKQK